MEPLPETAEADDLYGPFIYENADLLEQLVAMGDQVALLAPGCLGLSYSLVEEDVVFTVVDTHRGAAPRDAVQNAEGGPSVTPVATDQVTSQHDTDPLREESWLSTAAATSTAGIASTLSLPVSDHGRVTGAFNLYGATTTTFDGHFDEIARLLGAWAKGAVTNADLDFTTRGLAQQAPHLLRETTRLTVAAVLVANDQASTLTQAKEHLRNEALRAGVPLHVLVDSTISALENR